MEEAFRPEDLRFCYLGVYFGQYETKGCFLTHEGDDNHQYITYRSPTNEQDTKFHFRPPLTGDIEAAVLDAYFNAICSMIDAKIAAVKYIDGLTVVFPTRPKHLNFNQLEAKLEFKLSAHVRLQRAKKRITIALEHEMWRELIEKEQNDKLEGDYAVLHCSAYSFIYHHQEVWRDFGFPGGLPTADVLGWKGVEHLAKFYKDSSEEQFQQNALFENAKRELGVEDFQGLINNKNGYSAVKVAKLAEHMGEDVVFDENLADFGDQLVQNLRSFIGNRSVTVLLSGRLFDYYEKLFATACVPERIRFAKYKEEAVNDAEVTAALHAATFDGKSCAYQEKNFF